MIRKPTLSAKRLATGVLVAAVASAGAIALAGPASAAGTLNTLQFQPTSGTGQAAGTTNIDGTISTGYCAPYKIVGTDTDGSNDTTTNVLITLSGDNNANGDTQGVFCGGTTNAAAGTPGPVGGKTNTRTVASGSTIYVGATGAGTVNIAATSGGAGATATFNAVASANNAVASLTANPASETINSGGTAQTTLTAKASNGDPLQGVIISRNDATTNSGCTTTNANGQATCTVGAPDTTTSSTQTYYANVSGGTAGPDANEQKATFTITVAAAQAVGSIVLTCTDQLGNATNANPQTGCTAPANGSDVLTATAYQGAGTAASPRGNVVPNAVINFNLATGNTGKLNPTSGTTNANGVLTTTLTPAVSGVPETDTVTATASNAGQNTTTSNTSQVTFDTRAANSVSASPGNTSATTGSTITENVTVRDQFGDAYQPPNGGTQTVTLTVTNGRNVGQSSTSTTTGGKASLSYTDRGTTGSTDTVRISASDVTGSTDYTVTYVSSVTPSGIALNFVPTNQISANPTCATDTADPMSPTTNSNSAQGAAAEVCAVLKNSAGQTLSGQTVTFTVSTGKVGDSDVVTNTGDTTTYTATSSQFGVAVAYVTSSQPGAQTISAAANGVTSNTLTDTYVSSFPTQTVTVTPATATVVAGSTSKFTVKAVDKNGAPVQGDSIVVSQSGPGVVTNTYLITAADGTASAQLSTSGTDTGNGTISFTSGECQQNNAAGSTCIATATYTVKASQASVAHVLAAVGNGRSVGDREPVSATVTDSAGNPVVGTRVTFFVGGVQKVYLIGTTDSRGISVVSYTATKAGKVGLTAIAGGVKGQDTGTIAGSSYSTKLYIGSPDKGTLEMKGIISPKASGKLVFFYLVSGNTVSYSRRGTTDSSGTATVKVRGLQSGKSYTFVAREITGGPGPYSAKNTQKVS